MDQDLLKVAMYKLNQADKIEQPKMEVEQDF